MIINTEYPETVAESETFLRMVLKKIGETRLPFNPVSYLMWYEYAIGRNKQLTLDMEKLLVLKNGQPPEFRHLTTLYRKYMVDEKALLAEQKTREFQKILAEMSRQLSESSSGLENRGNTLEKYADKLSQTASLDSMTKIANDIVSETKLVIESSKALKNQLNSTKSEINELNKELEGLKKTAKIDMLTQLFNRHGFDEKLNQIMDNNDAPYAPLCFIMMDIDHFKNVNDTYGHLVGDNVLKMLGKLLKDHIKGKDIAARFGGEEFIVVLPQTPIDGAYTLAERIRITLSRQKLKIKNTGELLRQITISLGISLFQDGESINSAIERADSALYQAKRTGRNKTITELDL